MMEDLNNILNGCVSSIIDKQKLSRDAGKKKIEESGITKLFELIVKKTKNSLENPDKQTNEEKVIVKKIIDIAKSVFLEQKGVFLSSNICKVELYEFEGKNPDYYGIAVKLYFEDFKCKGGKWTGVSRLSILASASSNENFIQVFRNDIDDLLEIEPNQNIDENIKKIMEYLLE